jgi:hypothetical protein
VVLWIDKLLGGILLENIMVNDDAVSWQASVPVEIWHKFEDFGYFPEDVELYDALSMAYYIQKRMLSGDIEDYYTFLAMEHIEDYCKIERELQAFTDMYPELMDEIRAGRKKGGRL